MGGCEGRVHYLAATGQSELLRQLYAALAIADGVRAELNAFGSVSPGHDEVATAGWVERRSVVNTPLVETLRRDLDRGEAETIALALELKADLDLHPVLRTSRAPPDRLKL